MDVDDIVEVPAHHRTLSEWESLGRHHGDACVARALRELPEREWFRYLRAVRAGIEHLFLRGGNKPETGYYFGYLAQVDLYVCSARTKRNHVVQLRRAS